LVVIVALWSSAAAFAAAVQVYWASDPVGPGAAVMVIGDALGAHATVEIARLADTAAGNPARARFTWPGEGAKVEALQATENSLKFVVPATLPPGVFAYRITTASGVVTGLLNRPAIWWTQGNRGTSTSPGGLLHLFGKNLAASGAGGAAATVFLKGPRLPAGGSGETPPSPLRTVALTAQGDAYEATVALPADLPFGDYEVFVHNSRGGSGAWSEPAIARVEKPLAWPQTIFNVKDFAAAGTGAKDDTTPVQAALAAAEKNGGGVVYFPRGRYLVSAMLRVPRFTILRGEKRELVNLLWPDFPHPPESLVRGSNNFGIEDMTLYCANYKTIIAADTRTPEAGDVFLRRLRVRANLYYGHPEPEDVDRRYREGLKVGFGGGYWLAILGGRNVEVRDCDLYSAGCVISLTEPHGTRIEGNVLGAGRWGGSGVFGGDGVVIADNKYVGCDLMSWGAAGGLGFGNLQHVFIRRNSFALEHGGDRESITSDSSGEIYHGRIAAADALGITLPQGVMEKTPPERRDAMKGAAVYVVDGKGQGQWRAIARFEGPRIVVDRPWDVVPDASSTVATTYLLRQWLILDNDFFDTGVAVQIYGASLEHIIAGNRSARTAGFHNFGMHYNGIQPSWFVQWLGNEILEGNIFHGDHDNCCLSGEAHLGVFGSVGTDWQLPITMGTVLRGNRLHNNARIALGNETPAGDPIPGSRTDPLVKDLIVEDNLVENNGVGICISRTAHGVLLRNNHFHNVRQPVWEEAAELAAAERRTREICAQRGPVAAWSGAKTRVDGMDKTRFPDTTGHGFDAVGLGVQAAPEGVHGGAIKFSGESFLRADDAQVFNRPSFTLNLWIKPDAVAARQGLIGKRWGGVAAPFVLSLGDGCLGLEATDETNQWSFNFHSSAVVKAGVWNHLAAVVEAGKGVILYCNGKVVGKLDNPKKLCFNAEPLVLGREAWNGGSDGRPCFYHGLMDGVKIWARPLAAGEVQAEYERGRPAK
jgi:hypothetical protein